MTEPQREAITYERFTTYKKRLREHNATPMICLGIGHDAHSGELICCTTLDLSDKQVLAFLMRAVEMLSTQIHT